MSFVYFRSMEYMGWAGFTTTLTFFTDVGMTVIDHDNVPEDILVT